MTKYSNIIIKQGDGKPRVCSNCSSNNASKIEILKTETKSETPRIRRKNCNKRFVYSRGFFRMINNPIKITQAIDLFYRMVSKRKVQERLGIFYPHNSFYISFINSLG